MQERDTRQNATRPEDMPPAGPHATRKLTDRDKTPGAGTLPERNEDDVDPGTS